MLRGRGGGICCCAVDSEVDFQAACCLSGAFFVFLLPLPARLRGREASVFKAAAGAAAVAVAAAAAVRPIASDQDFRLMCV